MAARISIILKLEYFAFCSAVMRPTDADGMAMSVDPDQTALVEHSGQSLLIAKNYVSQCLEFLTYQV